MNKIEIIGRITADPAPQGEANKKHLNFAIAVDDGFGEKKKTHFFNCVAFGSTADFLARHLAKGMRVCLEGKLANNNYESKETGKTVYTNEIVVSEVTLIDSVQWRGGAQVPAQEPAAVATPASESRAEADMENLQMQADYLADEELPF